MDDLPRSSRHVSLDDEDFLLRFLKHLDGSDSVADSAAFEKELETDSKKRKLFVALCQQCWDIEDKLAHRKYVEVLLEQDSAAESQKDEVVSATALESASSKQGATRTTSSKVKISPFRLFREKRLAMPSKRHQWGALAAIILIGVTVVLIHFSSLSEYHAPLADEPSVTRLLASVDAVWAGGEKIYAGSPLANADYELSQGLVQIRFPTGAEVIVEGPAQFILDSESRITQLLGKTVVLCSTEESRGFEVVLPGARVVDLGTEFAVEVDDKGGAEVLVYEGKIGVFDLSQTTLEEPVKKMVKSEAATIGPDGQIKPLDRMKKMNFVRRSAFQFALRKKQSEWSEDDEAYLKRLCSDPALLLWYDMNPEVDQQSVSNLAFSRSGFLTASRRDGKLPFISGRFRRNLSIRMVHPDDRLEVDVPGEFHDLTLGAWVRLYPEKASQGERHRSLLMSDGWGSPGQVRWLFDGHALTVNIAFTVNAGESVLSATVPAFASDLDDNQWHFVVSSIRTGKHGSVSHYVDGKMIDRVGLTPDVTGLTLGPSSIGAWLPGESSGKLRNRLNGCIDDFLLWKRVLSNTEVKDLYEQTRLQPSEVNQGKTTWQ